MKNLLLKISIFLLSFQLSISAQDFDASVKTGCDSLTVKFTYTSPVAVTSVKWIFGDGTESTEASPQHKYTVPKNYTVSLTINNGTPLEKVDFIKVGLTPKADFHYVDTVPYGSHNVGFRAVVQDASAPFPYSYTWKISDGTTETLRKFVHEFDTTGIYGVKLTITDLAGCSDTITKAVVVRDKLYVPNVFSPNGDQYNELFIVRGDGVTTFKISIFTRSGVKIYENSAKTLVWDGVMMSGEKAKDGIFYYVIESVDSAVKLKQAGFFYIYTNQPAIQ